MCHIKIFFGKIFNDKILHWDIWRKSFSSQRKSYIAKQDSYQFKMLLFFAVCRRDRKKPFQKIAILIESSHFGASERIVELENKTA